MTNGRPPLGAAKRTPRGVRFNAAELATIRDRASVARLTLNGYIRHAALGRKIIAPVPELNRQAWADLARLAANLNQISRAANSGNLPAAKLLPSTLVQLFEQVRRLRLALIGNHDGDDT